MYKNKIEPVQLTYGRGYVYSVQYHIVWCTKDRTQILTDRIADDCRKILQEIADENGFRLLNMEIMPDYIYLLVDTSPQFHIPNMLRVMKGVLARKIFCRHPELKEKENHLWVRSYCIVTPSDRSMEQIRQYLESQKPCGHRKKTVVDKGLGE